MATPRTQVPELQFGVGYQPVASPALQAPVLRAPQVYQDDTVQALTEFANNFTQGFAKLKQVETQQDIILGEQMFLEQQPDFEGLFDSASPSLDSEAKFVRAKEIAEETSLGARIGFDRAAGRMLAAREQEVIEQAIQKAIVDGSAPDPTTGIPGNPSLFNADGAIARARAEFRSSVEKSSSNWVLTSPYAQEEYTSNMARLLPSAINKGRSELLRVKQEKFREQLMEETSNLIAKEMAKIGTVVEGKQFTVADAHAAIGTHVRNNAVRGGIANPREFLLDASYNAARMALTPKADGTVDTAAAERIFDNMASYRVDGASLTGGELGKKYWQYFGSLQTQIGNLNKAQDPNDRRKMAVDAVRTGNVSVFLDKDGKIVSEGTPGATRETLYRHLIKTHQNQGGVGVDNALADWQATIQPNSVFHADQFFISDEIAKDFKARPYSRKDTTTYEQMKNALATGDPDKADSLLAQIKDPILLNSAREFRSDWIKNEAAPITEDPIFKSEIEKLQDPVKYVDELLAQSGLETAVSPAQRQALINEARVVRDDAIAGLASPQDRQKPLPQRIADNRLRIKNAVRDFGANFTNKTAETKSFVDSVRKAQNDPNVGTAASIIEGARAKGLIDNDTSAKLLAEDKKINAWRDELDNLKIGDLTNSAVRTAALSLSPDSYLLTASGAGDRKELSIEGVKLASKLGADVDKRVKDRLSKNQNEFRAIQQPGGSTLLRNIVQQELEATIDSVPDLSSKAVKFLGLKPSKRVEVALDMFQRAGPGGLKLDIGGKQRVSAEIPFEDVSLARQVEVREQDNPLRFSSDDLPLTGNEAIAGKQVNTPRDQEGKDDIVTISRGFRKAAPFQFNYTPGWDSLGITPQDSNNKYVGDSAAFFYAAAINTRAGVDPSWAIKQARLVLNAEEQAIANSKLGGMAIKSQAMSTARVWTGLSKEEFDNRAYIVKRDKEASVVIPLGDSRLLNFDMTPIIPKEYLEDLPKYSNQVDAFFDAIGVPKNASYRDAIIERQTSVWERNRKIGI